MPVLGRPTLKRHFENGDGLTNRGFVDTIDSALSLTDTAKQTFVSDVVASEITTSGAVSAGDVSAPGALIASGGIIRAAATQGVSGVRGSFVVSQRATVNTTAMVAFLPTSNIVGLSVRVLTASSGAAGGTEIRIGDATASDFYGVVTVSAGGLYRVTNVCARRLQQASGALMMSSVTATAGASFIGEVEYYLAQSVSAGQISGHKYWRVRFTSITGGTGDGRLAEVEAYANQAATGTNLASSATASGDMAGDETTANDGVVDAGNFFGGTGAPSQLQYLWSSGQDVRSMKFFTATGGGYTARTYGGEIEHSDDGASWTGVASFSGENPGNNGGSFTVSW